MDDRDADPAVVDVPEARRFELRVGPDVATAEYEVTGDTLVFTHTTVPRRLQGGGVGGRLVREALASARRRGLQVIPRCPFVAAYLRRHPEYLEGVHPDYREALRSGGASRGG